MERLRKTPPQPSCETFTTAPIESEPGEFVLLRPAHRIQCFVRAEEAHVNASEISLILLPASPEENDFLRALKAEEDGDIAFAYRDYAAWVAPQALTETPSGWEVLLKKSEHQGKHNEKTFGDFTSDQLAQMRAKRILLDEKLSVASPWLLEYRVQNGLSLQYENGLAVYESPLPQLYQTFYKTPAHFKQFARLASVLYLELTHTVEEILQLDLELLEPAQLQVRFKGRRHQYFAIRDATILKFDGICPLSPKTSDKEAMHS